MYFNHSTIFFNSVFVNVRSVLAFVFSFDISLMKFLSIKLSLFSKIVKRAEREDLELLRVLADVFSSL